MRDCFLIGNGCYMTLAFLHSNDLHGIQKFHPPMGGVGFPSMESCSGEVFGIAGSAIGCVQNRKFLGALR